MNRIIILLFGVSFGMVVGFGLTYNYSDTTPPEPPSATAPSQLVDEQAYLDLINDYRASHGLTALVLNDKLNTSAQLKADDMKEDYWSHDSPDGVEPWHWFEVAGYKYSHSGENLARCFDNPKETVRAWIDSPSHRENILGDYTETGFGAYQGKCLVVVNHFGK